MATTSSSEEVKSTTTEEVKSTTTPQEKADLPPPRKPKYHPMRAHKIYRALNYTDNMITTQEAMLEQLRWTRRQLEKDDKQLREIQHKLYMHSFNKRPIVYHRQEEEEEEEEEE